MLQSAVFFVVQKFIEKMLQAFVFACQQEFLTRIKPHISIIFGAQVECWIIIFSREFHKSKEQINLQIDFRLNLRQRKWIHCIMLKKIMQVFYDKNETLYENRFKAISKRTKLLSYFNLLESCYFFSRFLYKKRNWDISSLFLVKQSHANTKISIRKNYWRF